jgi:hypothetical protein
MPEDFVIARNTEPGSTLPYLLRIPLGDGIILKAKDTWPRTGKVYCHRVEEWPVDAEIVERVPVRSCVRRGAAIDLVLDRGRENRSQIIITNARGRQMIFWQTARTSKQARPAAETRTISSTSCASRPGRSGSGLPRSPRGGPGGELNLLGGCRQLGFSNRTHERSWCVTGGAQGSVRGASSGARRRSERVHRPP